MFPKDIDFSKFELFPAIFRKENPNTWTIPIEYDHKSLVIQTPEMICRWPLNEYIYELPTNKTSSSFNESKQDNDNNGGKPKVKKFYSLCCLLDKNKLGHSEFIDFLQTLDNKIKDYVNQKYNNKISKNSKFTGSITEANGYMNEKSNSNEIWFRAKFVSNSQIFKCKVTKDNKEIDKGIQNMKQLLTQGTKVRLIIRLNPFWCNHVQKYGLSWQIMNLDIITERYNFNNSIENINENKNNDKSSSFNNKKELSN